MKEYEKIIIKDDMVEEDSIGVDKKTYRDMLLRMKWLHYDSKKA